MNRLSPIYTEKTQCQDCYKCLRHCPVKAIQVKDGSAQVITEMCILCGKCVEVCPSGAKQIRDDLSRAKQLLKKKKRTIVSLAPSWVSEFENLSEKKLLTSLSKLGFFAVSETALGAQIVSKSCSDILSQDGGGIYISSACPVIVEFLTKYQTDYAENLTNVLSPILAHSKLLRNYYGEDIGIVFISPCIAKKREAEQHNDLLDVSITFKDLKKWFNEEKINPYLEADSEDSFRPYRAEEGVLYPIDGGMIEGIKQIKNHSDVKFLTFSGIDNIKSILDNLKDFDINKKIFLELLSCNGGCINGPEMSTSSGIAKRRLNVEFFHTPNQQENRIEEANIYWKYKVNNSSKKEISDAEIFTALQKIGKHSRSDELNCGGCGYFTCRDFAKALVEEKAEPSMCVSYMRKLALNKANALLQKMPSGVVIVNKQLQIIECNKKFVEIIGGNAEVIYEVNPGLEGAYLNRLVPFHNYFKLIFDSSTKEFIKDVRFENKILRITLFEIDKDRIAGAIIQDITDPYVQRDHIINKAKEVIKKNLTTVQQIAFLLGENASESEILLQQIIDSFSPGKSDSIDDKDLE